LNSLAYHNKNSQTKAQKPPKYQVVIMVTMIKLVTSLLGAAVATAAVIPDQELGGLAVMNTSDTPGLKGGFIPHCCKHPKHH
jgi:hypothetical protein